MWYLRWAPFAIEHFTNPFYTHQLNAPYGLNAMWNTPVLSVAVVASPITLLFGPIFSYNVVITAAIALSGFCAFLLLRRLARGLAAPVIGGAVYGFSPYVIPHAAAHLDLTFAFAPPLFLLGMHELLVRRRTSPGRLGAALGVLAFVQLLTAEELVVTAAMLAAVLAAFLAFHRRSAVRTSRRTVTRALAAALLTFGILGAWPLAVQLLGPERVHGPLQNADTFSTDLLNLVLPTGRQLIAPEAATRLSSHFSGFDFEANAYVGMPLLLVLGAVAARRWADLRVRSAAVMGALAFVLSLGPHLQIGGHSTGWVLPLLPVLHVPLLENLQPNRIAVFMWLAISVLVTIGLDGAFDASAWRGSALRLLAWSIALAAVLPAPLPSATVEVPAFFRHWTMEGIPDGSTTLVAPFFRDGAGADPMLWAAVAGDAVRMPEAYGFVPLPDGTAIYGARPTQLSSVMEAIQDNGASIVARGPVRDQIARDLKAAGIRTVLVGPMPVREPMVSFFADLFGRAPQRVDGVELWREVDRSGVAPAPN